MAIADGRMGRANEEKGLWLQDKAWQGSERSERSRACFYGRPGKIWDEGILHHHSRPIKRLGWNIQRECPSNSKSKYHSSHRSIRDWTSQEPQTDQLCVYVLAKRAVIKHSRGHFHAWFVMALSKSVQNFISIFTIDSNDNMFFKRYTHHQHFFVFLWMKCTEHFWPLPIC